MNPLGCPRDFQARPNSETRQQSRRFIIAFIADGVASYNKTEPTDTGYNKPKPGDTRHSCS